MADMWYCLLIHNQTQVQCKFNFFFTNNSFKG